MRTGNWIRAGALACLLLMAAPAGASVERVAGGGGGDGGRATNATVPARHLAWSPLAGLVMVNPSQFVVRRLASDGTIDLVAGTYIREANVPLPPVSGDAELVPLLNPYSVAVDGIDVYHLSGNTVRYVVDGLTRPVIDTEIRTPLGLAAAPGALYVSDTGNSRVLRYAIPCGTRCAPPVVLATGVLTPKGLAVAADGTVYVVEAGRARVLAIRPDGTTFTAAGGGVNTGDGGSASEARLNGLDAVAVDPADGTLFIAEAGSNRVRRVSGGVISTVMGTGQPNWLTSWTVSTDPLAQPITQPSGLAVGGGYLYVSSELDARIYRVSLTGVPTATVVARTATPTITPAIDPQQLAGTSRPTLTRTATPEPPPASPSATQTVRATITPSFTPTWTASPVPTETVVVATATPTLREVRCGAEAVFALRGARVVSVRTDLAPGCTVLP